MPEVLKYGQVSPVTRAGGGGGGSRRTRPPWSLSPADWLLPIRQTHYVDYVL